jgi:arylsulfatase A-like enzyme
MLMGCQANTSHNKKPNIILIYTDDVGYGDLSLNGCHDIQTHHIDQLAASGINCTNGYVTSSISGPSRAGILTGKYQQRFGITENHMAVPLSEKLLPEYLKETGYKTAIFGKWHLSGMKGCYDTLINQGYHPLDRGFDEFFGFYGCQAHYFSSDRLVENRDSVYSADYLTDVLADKTVDFIREHKEEPFFIYLAFNATHSPMEVSEKYLKPFEHIDHLKRPIYLGMLKALDDAVGEVVNEVYKLGIEKNTMILFINDNGGKVTTGSSNLPLRGRKYGVFEGGIKVPFIISWPDQIKAGSIYKEPVSTVDILPTILAAAGLSPIITDGVNLFPYFNNTIQETPHNYLFWKSEYSQSQNTKARENSELRDWSALRYGKWKFHCYLNEETNDYIYELYNLDTDQGESLNVIEDNRALADSLKNKLKEWETEMHYAPYPVKLKH